MIAKAKKLERFPEEVYLETALREGRATRQEVSMKALGKPDHSLQCRVFPEGKPPFDMDHVRRLGGILLDTGQLYPVVIFRDPKSGKLHLADGFHRHEAYRIDKRASIPAVVVEGTRSEALQYAAMCNRIALLQRKPEDIKKAVESLFAVEECWGWADTVIAKHVGCSQRTVTRCRSAYSQDRGLDMPREVIKSDGTYSPYRRRRAGEPIKMTRRTGRKSPQFSAHVNGKEVYLGINEDEAARRLDRIIAEETGCDRGKVSESSNDHVESLSRMGIHATTVPQAYNLKYRIPALLARDAVIVWTNLDRGEDIPLAVGRVLLAHATTGDDRRKVVFCPKGKGCAELMVLATDKFGIEFLTPDELVDSLGATDGGTAPGIEAVPSEPTS